ncbi:hypothetical protein ABE354_23845 [Brevibacillus laterosporus]|uniref:DUF7448 domain-containing protein n=1 Tax=Brevibacillus laterosporus TaxID=1465 RepID=UPI003D26231D
MVHVNVLSGKELTKIDDSREDELLFYTEDGECYRMYHEQDCCEHVFLEDICGDLDDLLGTPLLLAEEVSEERGPVDGWDESYTWTFYKFATIKGSVTLRWYGTSNGYYSESVDFELIEEAV